MRGRPPHESINANRAWAAQHEAEVAALEAKYGVPYEKLPSILQHDAPDHPQRGNARRFDYLTRTSYRWYSRSRRDRRRLIAGPGQRGWREQRANYLQQLEARRLAEVEVRKLRTKRTGRGRPEPRNLLAASRYAIEDREWREEL